MRTYVQVQEKQYHLGKRINCLSRYFVVSDKTFRDSSCIINCLVNMKQKSLNWIIWLLDIHLLTTLKLIHLCSGDCPVSKCNWFPWESWSDCSRTCGGGTRSRYRYFCCKASLTDDIEACMADCGMDNWSHRDGFWDYSLCNTNCHNGGTFIQSGTTSGHCRCSDYYYGDCCLNQKTKVPNDLGRCSELCNWTPWESWNTCSVSCGGGGVQERTRYLCCQEYHDFHTCAFVCGTDINDRNEGRSCGATCLNGGTIKPSGLGCDCLNRTFGHCCEELLPGCVAFPTDVIFILDSSASQTKAQFSQQLEFVSKFLDHVNISAEEFQIAVITFSTDAAVEITFNQSTDVETLRQLVKKIRFRPGATFTNKGLLAAAEVARKSERRKGMVTLTYAFVLTDGMSNNRKETRLAADQLKKAEVHVVAIGIGDEVSHQELTDIASSGHFSNPPYVFSAGDFNSLYTLLKQLVHVTCKDCSDISHLSDIIFLIDESIEMSDTEFQLSVDIIESMINGIEHIGETNGSRISLMRLGNELETRIEMSNGQTQQGMLVKLQSTKKTLENSCLKDKQCSKGNITSAIEYITEFSFNTGRENAKRFLIVVSSGRFENTPAIKEEMAKFHNGSDVKVFAIGPGLEIRMEGLLSLVKEANHVYATHDEDDLAKLSVMQSEFSYNECSLK